jgi:hypothetical protein
VAHRFAQQLGRLPHDPRHEAARVDDGVPAAAAQRVQVPVPVAAQLLDLREELGVRHTPVEERHLVSAGERRLDDGAAEELRPAEDEELHSASSSPSSRSTSSAVL